MKLFTSVRRAFALVAPGSRRRLIAISVGSVLVAALDAIALLLLVPLLSYLGAGSSSGAWKGRLEGFLGTSSPSEVAAILAGVAVALFVLRSFASICLLWLQLGALNNAQEHLGLRILRAFASADWLTQRRVVPSEMIRTTPNATSSIMAGVLWHDPLGSVRCL